MMKSYYALVGAGGHGREVMPMLRKSLQEAVDRGDVELIFVAEGVRESLINGHRLLALDNFLKLDGVKLFNVAIADSSVRERIARLCISHGVLPLSVIAPSAIVLDYSEIGEACMISDQTIVTSNVKIGRFFQANCQCNISHDCVIGDFVTFAPGVKCNGNVTIGNHAYIGAGAVLKQGRAGSPLTIGEGAIVGMGAVVIRDVAPFTTVVGNPARPMAKK